MMIEWRFIDKGPCTASYNMAIDEAIATSVRNGSQPPTLRLYEWDRLSVSLGLFQKVTDVNLQYCINNDIPIVRRPTGGRAILHGDELTYSFSSRNDGYFSCGLLDAYRQLSIAFKKAFGKLGLETTMKRERESGRNLTRSPLCFQSKSYGEITFRGEKLIGSAQKRWKSGFLQQGTILYGIDEEAMKNVFRTGSTEYLKDRITGLRDAVPDLDPDRFKEAVRMSFEEAFQIKFISSSFSQEEYLLAQELEAQKYLSAEWNFQG